MQLRPDHNARPLHFKKTSRNQKLEERRHWKPKATSKAQINIQISLVSDSLMKYTRSEFQMSNHCRMKQNHQFQTAIWIICQTKPWISLQIAEAIDRKG